MNVSYVVDNEQASSLFFKCVVSVRTDIHCKCKLHSFFFANVCSHKTYLNFEEEEEEEEERLNVTKFFLS
jgi:hypothetical protein